MMKHTTALEEKITAGAGYLDCFKGSDLRRTEIVCAVWAMQVRLNRRTLSIEGEADLTRT